MSWDITWRTRGWKSGVWGVIALFLAGAFTGLGCSSQASPSVTGEHGQDDPLFSFGLLSDVQYADKDTVGKRRYREGLTNLESCVDDLSTQDLGFVVHCGDIIDGRGDVENSLEDLNRALEAFSSLTCKVHHVIGNHCLEVPRAELEKSLGIEQAYYSFIQSGWRFINVDAMAFSICGLDGSDPTYLKAREWLDQHKRDAYPCASPWNGGLGEPQREWL